MQRPALIVFGTGAHARKVFHCWLSAGGSVAAFADENPRATAPVPGVPVLAAAALQAVAVPGLLCIGIGDARVRSRLMDRFAAAGWALPAAVHRRSSVAPGAVLEDGVVVAAGAVLESGVRVGRGAIVDIGALLDHDCTVAPFAHVRAGQVCAAGSRWPA